MLYGAQLCLFIVIIMRRFSWDLSRLQQESSNANSLASPFSCINNITVPASAVPNNYPLDGTASATCEDHKNASTVNNNEDNDEVSYKKQRASVRCVAA